MMVLLAEKPQYNDKIYAVSLMAPAIYMNHDGILYQIIARFGPLLNVM